MIIKTNTQIQEILEDFGFNDVLLEDVTYQIMEERYFEPKLLGSTALKRIIGFKVVDWALGASDCGKFCINYQSSLIDKYRNKFVRSSSGGGDSDGYSGYGNNTDHYPALLLGFVKYLRRDGQWHIVNGTIINHGGNYIPVFFERTSNGFNWVILNDQEKSTLKYFHAY